MHRYIRRVYLLGSCMRSLPISLFLFISFTILHVLSSDRFEKFFTITTTFFLTIFKFLLLCLSSIFLYKLWWWFIIIHIFIYTYIYYLYIIYIYIHTIFFIYILYISYVAYIFFSLVVLGWEAFGFVRTKLHIHFSLFRSVKSCRFSTSTEHVGLFHFSTWLQFLLLSLFFLFSFSFIVSTRYLFSTLSSRFFLFFFPAKFHQTFLLFHEMACVHCLVLFKYFFFLFFSSPSPLCIGFFGGKSGEGDFRHGSVCESVDATFCVVLFSLSLLFSSLFPIRISVWNRVIDSIVCIDYRFGFGSDS